MSNFSQTEVDQVQRELYRSRLVEVGSHSPVMESRARSRTQGGGGADVWPSSGWEETGADQSKLCLDGDWSESELEAEVVSNIFTVVLTRGGQAHFAG